MLYGLSNLLSAADALLRDEDEEVRAEAVDLAREVRGKSQLLCFQFM